jgi:hypothetical protein
LAPKVASGEEEVKVDAGGGVEFGEKWLTKGPGWVMVFTRRERGLQSGEPGMAEHSRSSEELAERRLDPRFTVEVPAALVWGDERYEGTLRNLSMRGFYLTMEVRAEELKVEDPVAVVFGEPEESREATVVHVAPAEGSKEPVGVGVLLHDPVDIRALSERYL